MIELKRNDIARGDSEREAKVRLDKLADLERKRDGYIELAAEGLMDRDELRAKLASLEETRQTARQELEGLERQAEEIAQLEADRDALLDSLEAAAPEALETLTPEERHGLYKMLKLQILIPAGDGPVEATWAFKVPVELDVLSSSKKMDSSRYVRMAGR